MPQNISIQGKKVLKPIRLKYTPNAILWRSPKVNINKAGVDHLVSILGIKPRLAQEIIKIRKKGTFRSADELKRIPGITPRIYSKIADKIVIGKQKRPFISGLTTDPVDLRAGKPFDLVIDFDNPLRAKVNLMQLILEWKGSPYVTQKKVTDMESRKGTIRLEDIGKRLPVGPVDITIIMYDSAGGADYFAQSFYVMPNSVSLNVWPSGRTLPSGSWRGRADYNSAANTFGCGISFDISNTESHSVTFRTWNFRVSDASLGELDNWNWNFPFDIVVGPGSVWSGWIYITFHSGGTHNLFKKGGDVTIRYRTTSTSGAWTISDTQVFGSMKGFGVNRIRVGTFTSGELNIVHQGLLTSATGIFEQRDLTIDEVDYQYVPSPGSYNIINSEGEAENLLEDWNGPRSRIDGFFVEDIAYGGVLGLSPVDGPCDRDLKNEYDGLIVEPRGSIDAMGQTWAHELGHYLGLEHHSGDTNLMYEYAATWRTDLTYDQYKEMRDHCYVELLP